MLIPRNPSRSSGCVGPESPCRGFVSDGSVMAVPTLIPGASAHNPTAELTPCPPARCRRITNFRAANTSLISGRSGCVLETYYPAS